MDQGVAQQVKAEAMRRYGGQVPSAAGIPGGAPVANATANPMAARLASSQQPPTGNPTMPTTDNPFGGANAAMLGSAPVKGGTKIEKALIERMKMYPPA